MEKKKALATLLVMFVLSLPFFSYTTQVKAEEKEFVIGWMYDPPPVSHFNPWAPGNLFYGWYFTQEPLFWYLDWNDTYIPWLGESWKYNPTEKTLTVHLRKGVLWHDGSLFTSKDVLTTVYVTANYWYPCPGAPSRSLLNVTAPDDYTVVWKFNYTTPLTIPETLMMTIQPYSLFGEWADRIRQAAWSGANLTVLTELHQTFLRECRPPTIIGTGPFKFKTATDIEIIYEKFDLYWRGAENIKFDRVRVLRVPQDVYVAMFVQGTLPWTWWLATKEQLDYVKAHPETWWVSFVPDGDVSVVILNAHRYPLSIPEVRKAIYYAFNTTEYQNIAIPGEGLLDGAIGRKGLVYPLSTAYGLFGKEFVDSLNDYGTSKGGADLKKAEEIFLSLGFKKDAEGIWVTPNGTRLEFSCLYIPAWWSVLADAFVAQMARIGIKIRLVGTTWTPYCQSLFRDHEYDMYLRFGCWFSIHPWSTMNNIFVVRNSWEGIPAPYPLHEPQIVDAPEWVASWIVEKGRPWLVGERGINVTRFTIELGILGTEDPEKMREGLKFLTWYCNEYPFYLPYTLSGRTYAINKKLVSGFPTSPSHPLWHPYPYQDVHPYILWTSLGMFGPVVPYTGTYTVVYILEEIPGFLGVDGNYYGPYKRGDVVSLPEEDATRLISKGLASYSPPVYSYVTVYAKATIPAFTGVDGKIYGPFKEGDALLIPKEDAERLVSEGVATYTPVEISRAVSDLLERVSRVETEIENVRTDLATLSESVNNLAKSIDTLSGQIPSILATVTGIGAVTIILLIIAIIMTLRKK
jgi:peptide/nickel transport system substrate-binding protein